MTISELAQEIQTHDRLSTGEKIQAEQIMLRNLVITGFDIRFLNSARNAAMRASQISQLDTLVHETIIKNIRGLIDIECSHLFISGAYENIDQYAIC